MSVKKDLKRLASHDSRRFAKGTMCYPITDAKTLAIMRKYRLIPPGIILNGRDTGGNKWIDTVTGKFFAIPAGSLDEYVTILDDTPYVLGEETTNDKTNEEISAARQQENAFVEFLKQAAAVVTITANQLNGSLDNINPDKYVAVIETVDINQTLTCQFVQKPGFFTNGKDRIA